MKFTKTPFNILKNTFNNKPLVNISCSIDDVQVPIEECGIHLEVNKEISNLDFWETECESHPTNSHCKVYDD